MCKLRSDTTQLTIGEVLIYVTQYFTRDTRHDYDVDYSRRIWHLWVTWIVCSPVKELRTTIDLFNNLDSIELEKIVIITNLVIFFHILNTEVMI